MERVLRTTKKQRGRWLPGVSGNPGGRPLVLKEFREFCQHKTIALAHRMVEIIENEKRYKASDRIQAFQLLANYGFGKPVAQAEITVHKPQPLQILSVGNLLNKPPIDVSE